MPGNHEILHSATTYTGAFFRVVVDTIRLPGGRTTTREIVRHPGAVSILLAVGLIWADLGWVTLVALVAAAVAVLVTWRSFWPDWSRVRRAATRSSVSGSSLRSSSWRPFSSMEVTM